MNKEINEQGKVNTTPINPGLTNPVSVDKPNFNVDTRTSSGKSTTTHQKEGFRDKVGEAVEKLGHKVANAGMPSTGQKIHDLGDKIEKTHRNPNHPHST